MRQENRRQDDSLEKRISRSVMIENPDSEPRTDPRSEECRLRVDLQSQLRSRPRVETKCGGARRRRRRRPPTASRLKGPRKQKRFAYKLLKRGLANLMSPTSTSGVAPPLARTKKRDSLSRSA
ncbi:hypothetical protein EVAR_59620_1 [Eumeta japonica]|uniref:Uncharacterized protein n=1 Tax=Eumeta variegata TaxID=151549 RepID=A0A4C1ZCQ4_EUMVA|nr:hypothetical protein EVAR_59620_1 [Eumeta japonica]